MSSLTISFQNINSHSFSPERIGHILNNNHEQATKISWLDWFLDFFRTETKTEAIATLVKMCEEKQHHPSNFSRFNHLATLAAPNAKHLFTVSISENNSSIEKFDIQFKIAGKTIKTDIISNAEKIIIAQNIDANTNLNAFEGGLIDINEYLLDMSEYAKVLKYQDFEKVGSHKKVNKETGYILAENSNAKEQLKKEEGIRLRADNLNKLARPALARYISTQKTCEPPAVALPGNAQYARYDIYDEDHVDSYDMQCFIDHLPIEEANALVTQLLQILSVFYENNIAHCDLHMNNIIVHQMQNKNIIIKAIDFGNSVFNQEFRNKKFTDISYIFLKKGSTIFETAARNMLSSSTAEINKKHYPLHKIFENFNKKGINVDNLLEKTGKQLIADLKEAEFNPDLIQQAFSKASVQTLNDLESIRSTNQTNLQYI